MWHVAIYSPHAVRDTAWVLRPAAFLISTLCWSNFFVNISSNYSLSSCLWEINERLRTKHSVLPISEVLENDGGSKMTRVMIGMYIRRFSLDSYVTCISLCFFSRLLDNVLKSTYFLGISSKQNIETFVLSHYQSEL